MAWRLAGSLIRFRDQVNAIYPGRNKASDGTIGDTAHQGTVSDHNPDNNGVVAAIDITHDPAHGLDIARLADGLASSRDSRIKYIIRNRQILIPPNWNWQNYTGSNPHTKHLHLSVNRSNYDDTRDWKISSSNNQQGVTIVDMQDGQEVYSSVLHRPAESAAAANQWNGLKPEEALRRARASQEWRDQDYRIKNFDKVLKEHGEKQASIDSLQGIVNQRDVTIIDLQKKLAEKPTTPPQDPDSIAINKDNFWEKLKAFFK